MTRPKEKNAADSLVHQPVLAPFVLRVRLLEVGRTGFHGATAAGGEDVEHLSAQVVGFDEGVDDGGGSVPPNREADPHGVVVGDILATAPDGGTRAFVPHLEGRARGLVAPVEVGIADGYLHDFGIGTDASFTRRRYTKRRTILFK